MDLAERLADPGYTPGRKEIHAVLALVDDASVGEAAVRALARAGLVAGLAAAERATPGSVAVVGRVARAHDDPRLSGALVRALASDDARVRKAAIVAMGKIRSPVLEAALVERHAVASEIDKRAIVVSLGKIGGERALGIVRASEGEGARRAQTMLERDLARAPSEILLDERLPRAMTLVWRCRRGLEEMLAEEVGGAISEREVKARAQTTLRAALAARVALDVCIEWRLERKPAWEALSHPILVEAMKAWTRGPVRFRAAFARGGHRRAELWELAQKLAERTREVASDPTGASWDVLIEEERLLLCPKAFDDFRFAYRARDVPAASHPTIAAALARAAGAGEEDVVWDPFVGSGLELAERARLGPFARLVGTDASREALEAARVNLAGLNVELREADARVATVPGVTLVITNPPMGRRLARDRTLGALYDAFLANIAQNLRAGGRVVWLSARPLETARRASELGFEVHRGAVVDVGGFDAELQILTRSAKRRAPSSRP